MASRPEDNKIDAVTDGEPSRETIMDSTAFDVSRIDRRSRLFGRAGHLRLSIGAALAREFDHGRGFLWLPVGMAIGVGIYFLLPREPWLTALAVMLSALIWLARRVRSTYTGFAFTVFAAAIAAGLVAAKCRTELVKAPRLDHERSVNVTGWIEAAELAKRGYRLTLRVATMEGVPGKSTPKRIRISARGKTLSAIRPGDAVSVRARLRPPQGPVMPGGYDFARAQFFSGLGATGFTFGAPEKTELGTPPMSLRVMAAINTARIDISARIREVLENDTGALASALIVGMRRGISGETEDALRKSGLAHILAISGLHMALVAGSVYWAIRAMLALFPAVVLNRPIRKWAAMVALAFAAFYLLFSGAGVATQRAFVMIAVVFIAILSDRPGLTMRSVAVAGLIVITIAPETVVGPSFQMSFAAVIALVAVYEFVVSRQEKKAGRSVFPVPTVTRRILRYAVGLMLTSIIAGLATAPFAAMHFHRVAPLGLMANLAAMPLVAFLVMPLGVLSVLAMPFGLDPYPLLVMGWGIDQVAAIAKFVAELTPSGAVVGTIPTASVILFSAGIVWLAFWQTKLRLAGIAAIAAGLAMVPTAIRPDVLISADGRIAALRGIDGKLVLSGKSRNKFTIQNWLRSDGDPRASNDPTLLAASRCDRFGCIMARPGQTADDAPYRIAVIRRSLAYEEDCRIADIVISATNAPAACASHTLVFDKSSLARNGAAALYFDPSKPNGVAKISYALPKLRRPWHPRLPGRSGPVDATATAQ